MAVASSINAIFALHGLNDHTGNKLSNLRILARLLTYRAGFVVRRESDIRKIADFKGRRFPIGFTGHSILATLARAAFATEGMNFKDANGTVVENIAHSMGNLVAGRIEGSFIAPGSQIVCKTNALVKIRFLSIKQNPQTTAIVRRIAPGAFFSVVKPRRRLSYIDKPTTFLGVDFLILTGSGVRSSVVYETVKTLYLNRKSLIARHPLYRNFESKLIVKKGIGRPITQARSSFTKKPGSGDRTRPYSRTDGKWRSSIGFTTFLQGHVKDRPEDDHGTGNSPDIRNFSEQQEASKSGPNQFSEVYR